MSASKTDRKVKMDEFLADAQALGKKLSENKIIQISVKLDELMVQNSDDPALFVTALACHMAFMECAAARIGKAEEFASYVKLGRSIAQESVRRSNAAEKKDEKLR